MQGPIRVRLTVWKDILSVLRMRYMSTIFQLSGLLLAAQLAGAVYHLRLDFAAQWESAAWWMG